MKRRCRSLLALPNIFGSSPNINTDESFNDCNLNPNNNNNNTQNHNNNSSSNDNHLTSDYKSKLRLFGNSNQNVNNISTTSSTSSSTNSHSTKTNAKKFLKSLLTSSREKQLVKSSSTTSSNDITTRLHCSDQHDPPIPEAIDWLLADLYRRGPNTVGVFRKSPNARHCRELKQRLESVKDLRELDLDSYQVIVIASVFKEWLRSMPDCLLTSRLYSHWIDIARLISLDEEQQQGQNENEKPSSEPINSKPNSMQNLKIIKQLLARLGENKLQLLASFVCVLSQIAQSSDFNKMSPINLGVCVGQSLLVEPDSYYANAISQSTSSPTTGTLQQKNRSRSKTRLDCSPQGATSAISCVPLLIAFIIENANLLFGEQLSASQSRYAKLAKQITAISSSSSTTSGTSSAIETPTPNSSRPTTPRQASDQEMQQQQHSSEDGEPMTNTSSLLSGTPSPADSGRCTTGDSSSSSSSSSASDSSFQMMQIEPVDTSSTSCISLTNCDRLQSKYSAKITTTTENAYKNSKLHNTMELEQQHPKSTSENCLQIKAEIHHNSNNNNNNNIRYNTQPTEIRSPIKQHHSMISIDVPMPVACCDVTDSLIGNKLTVKRMAPQPPSTKATATTTTTTITINNNNSTTSAAQRRLQYKQTAELRSKQQLQCNNNIMQQQQQLGNSHLTSSSGPRRVVSMSASDLAQQRAEMGSRNWCLSYYTPWREPSRSHVMSLRDYYISLQLEHQRQQEQLNVYKQSPHSSHNGYSTTTRIPHTMYQHQRHSIHLPNQLQQQQQQQFNIQRSNQQQQHQHHHHHHQSLYQQQNERNLHQHHLLNHHQAPFVTHRPFAGSDEYIESTLV